MEVSIGVRDNAAGRQSRANNGRKHTRKDEERKALRILLVPISNDTKRVCPQCVHSVSKSSTELQVSATKKEAVTEQ